MSDLGLEAFPVATQTYPRKQDYRVVSALAGLGASLYKFAFDLRVLQSPPIGEWAEPFGSRQVGSERDAFQAQPDPRRKHGQPGALPGRAAPRGVG